MSHLSALVKKSVEEINKEFNSLVKINNQVVYSLERLRKSYRLVLCSNASSTFLQNIIRDHNLEYLFDKIIISSDIKYRKPTKQFFNECLELSECLKEEIIFIDDNKENIESAKNFGVQTTLFTKNEDLLQLL